MDTNSWLDLALALSLKYRLRQEWHVLMVLIILMTTLFFCHSLVRLCIDVTSTERSRNGSVGFSRVPSIAGPEGYANPRTPIRVNTQSPQFNEGMKEPPPVYGLWRCSVRVNPDEFYWVRRRSATPNSPHTISEEATSPIQRRSMTLSPRPPSYLSDDGVSYVVNAVPEIRTEPPLPPHPSEIRRIA
ncbi:hypothetical protein K440DRAFT_532996 [Wilcoxina mikolae CBS 423.85]|nr:hypothetical protein K440DRAFT_532996 [Wilcoxina mikolae CBS 423.85]